MAGWYDSAWTKRIPFTVPLTALLGSPADVSFALPTDWDDFWDNVKSAGEDVRVCAPDGVTLLTYQLVGFNATTRVCTLELDNVPVADYTGTGAAADGSAILWLYWGNSAAVDAQGSFTVSSAATGGIYLGQGSGPGWVATRPVPGATNPSDEFAKTTAETLDMWVRVSGLLDTRATDHNGSLGLDGVSYVIANVEQAGTPVSSMFSTADAVLAVEPTPGDLRVSLRVKAGTDANDYTVSPTIATYLLISSGHTNQTFNPRAILRVNDISEV